MTKDFLYNKTTLDNGLRVVTEKIPYVHSVSIGLWILAGTVDESRDNNGVAHFLEHMVFKGTESRSSFEIADSLEALGGHLNAFTSKEITCYYAHVLDENIDLAVDILTDLIMHPRLADEDISKEKQVVVEEINELKDSPEELVQEYFIQSLYEPHPISFSTLGTKESVNSLTRRKILDFLKSNYTADRIVVAAAGNLEHEKIVELSRKYLQELPVSSNRNSNSLPKEKQITKRVSNNFLQAHICMGRRSFSYSDKRRYPMLLLNTILGFGMSSKLFQNIREKHGLAYSIYSFADFLKNTGVFGIYLGTDKEKIDKAIELIETELDTFKCNLVDKEELEKKKNQLKGNLLLGLESTSNRMNRLAKTEINYNRFFSINTIITSIDSVTIDQIYELSCWLFKEKKLSKIILEPAG